MEESVALNTGKQKQFVKSIQLIKKRIKKNDVKPELEKKDNADKVFKRKPIRGLVYLSHIPHGFYEHQMTQYFKQFGVVTNARVIRSKRTGNSKGFAFVEFKDTAVAQIVSETMNNYLMGKRLIKAVYIPPEKQRRAFRKNWNTQNNPGTNMRREMMKTHNAKKTGQQELKSARQHLKNLERTKSKLSELGINYDFFTPVDIPEALLKVQNVASILKKEDVSTKRKLPVVEENTKNKKSKKSNEIVKPEVTQRKGKVQDQKVVETVSKKIKLQEQKQVAKKPVKAEVVLTKADKKQQKQKQDDLKGKGVKPVEEFIKLLSGSEAESDSDFEFDSDEYEKMMGSESDADSNNADAGSDNDVADSENDDASSDNDADLDSDRKSDDELSNASDDGDEDLSDDDDLSDKEVIIRKSPPKKEKSKNKPQPIVKQVKQNQPQSRKPQVKKQEIIEKVNVGQKLNNTQKQNKERFKQNLSSPKTKLQHKPKPRQFKKK